MACCIVTMRLPGAKIESIALVGAFAVRQRAEGDVDAF